MAFSQAVKAAYPAAIWRQGLVSLGEHATAADANKLYPDYVKIAVMRNPWEIFASHWGWARRWSRKVVKGSRTAELATSQASRTFAEAVQYAIATPDVLCDDGGFYQHFCDSQTYVYRYEDRAYQRIQADCRLNLDMKVRNATVHPPPVWDRRSIDRIRHHCRGDIEKFGYEPPAAAKLND